MAKGWPPELGETRSRSGSARRSIRRCIRRGAIHIAAISASSTSTGTTNHGDQKMAAAAKPRRTGLRRTRQKDASSVAVRADLWPRHGLLAGAGDRPELVLGCWPG